ncbi:fam-d protein [Plasmodium vinckei lentum]|uniref:Fam-d protein n=1 Tax=Plasmodium vinckei lentum TaxID=138297 RepID=A0A6V7S684_PLAVN|nr:fam-d protein [Plasmodium vinckei lentum]
MRNTILSFFILLIFSNVKAATFQDVNNNSPKSIAYASVAQPIVRLCNYEGDYSDYADIIDHILYYDSENTKYAYQGNNYHWAITDFDISLNNYTRDFDNTFCRSNPRVIISSTLHFISYIKENIKCLATQHICKYDFENNHDDNLKKLANDLKGLIYDKFDNDSEGKMYDEFVNNLKGFIYDKYGKDFKGLICDRPRKSLKGFIHDKFGKCLKGSIDDKSNNDLKQRLTSSEDKTANENPQNEEKEYFKGLVDNSEINIRGYFIKIRKDGNYTDLCQNKSLYFNIRISKNDANVTHDLKHPQPEVAELVSKPLKKTISLLTQIY